MDTKIQTIALNLRRYRGSMRQNWREIPDSFVCVCVRARVCMCIK